MVNPEPTSAPARTARPEWPAHALALATACALAFSNTFENAFLGDDRPVIVENPRVHRLAHAVTLFVTPYWGHSGMDLLYRPLTMLTYALDWALWSGPDGKSGPGGFHLTNLLLHALATLALYDFLRRLTRAAPPAFWAALLFAVHPIHTEAVTGIVGRAEVLCALFSFLAAGAYLRFRDHADSRPGVSAWFYAGSLACFGLALLSKEMALTLPGLLLLSEAYRAAVNGDAHPLRNRFSAASLLPLTGFAALLVVYFAVRVSVLGQAGPQVSVFDRYEVAFPARPFIALAVLADYARLLVLPVSLRADYLLNTVPDAQVGGPADPFGLVCALAVLAIVSAGVLTARRVPWLAFGIGWFLISIIPVSNLFVSIAAIKAERFLYLPSVGGVVVLAHLLGAGSARPTSRARWATAAIAFLFLVLTVDRNRSWADHPTLFSDVLRKERGNGHAMGQLATVALAAGEVETALRLCNAGIEATPRFAQLYLWRAQAYRRKQRMERALSDLDRAVELDQGAAALQQRARHLRDIGRMEDAHADLERAVTRWPRLPALHDSLGLFHLEGMEDAQAAIPHFDRAIALSPGDAVPLFHRAYARMRLSDWSGAWTDYDAALRSDPGSSRAWEGRGIAAYRLGTDLDRAMADLRQALRLDPTLAPAHNFLALCLLALDRRNEAHEVVDRMGRRGIAWDAELRERWR